MEGHSSITPDEGVDGKLSSSRKRSRTEPSGRALYPRKRAVAACQLCRTRKIKCDNARPTCHSCVSAGVECVYQGDKADFSSFDAPTLAIIDRVNHVGNLVEAQVATLRSIAAQLNSSSTPRADYYQSPDGNGTANNFHLDVRTIHGSIADGGNYAAGITEQSEDEAFMSFESLELETVCHGNSEDILEWPIFEGKHTRAELETLIFESHSFGTDRSTGRTGGLDHLTRDYRGVQEEDAARLVNTFLAQVHTKNPILDSRQLSKMAKDMSEHGFQWDAESCLVLLACALGCLASPFTMATVMTSDSTTSEDTNALSNTPNYPTAEKYYVAARKRIALLDHSVITTQCHFLSGVYEMYSFRPVYAWTSFNRACMTLQLCLRSGPNLYQDKVSKSVQRRLFWSCLKSECEVRMEIHVPSSGLAKVNPSDVFPTPPSGIQSPRQDNEQLNQVTSQVDSFEVDQEKSWYYYLAEIAIRRIINRLMNVFYKKDEVAWLSMSVDRMIRIAAEIEIQIAQWQRHLPAPVSSPSGGSEHIAYDSDELTQYLNGRPFEAQERLYRPFLYIAISRPYESVLRSEILQLAKRCVQICVSYCLKSYRRHRHHGTWYHTREMFRMSLLILAAVKSRRVEVPEDWQAAVNKAILILKYWEDEAADVKKSREIVQDILQEVDERQNQQYHDVDQEWEPA
jgi:Fungal Zn(2)-Cys(6) binuclear cluster domain